MISYCLSWSQRWRGDRIVWQLVTVTDKCRRLQDRRDSLSLSQTGVEGYRMDVTACHCHRQVWRATGWTWHLVTVTDRCGGVQDRRDSLSLSQTGVEAYGMDVTACHSQRDVERDRGLWVCPSVHGIIPSFTLLTTNQNIVPFGEKASGTDYDWKLKWNVHDRKSEIW